MTKTLHNVETLIYNFDMVNLSNFSSSKPLVVLEMANNHNGSLDRAIKIVNEIKKISIPRDITIGIKLQYRSLPEFIHPKFRERRDLKYVSRFLDTRLDWDEFLVLKSHIESQGFLTVCTPFDEYSVLKVIEHDFDILKIASASFTDWALLESLENWRKPIILSTAAASLYEIDRVVSFLRNRNFNFALMHCVAEYPTPDSSLSINRISALKRRFENIPIGYSTHEDPKNELAGPLALAAGASVFEKHIGIEDEENRLNDYSCNPEQIEKWLVLLQQSVESLGKINQITSVNQAEINSLKGLKRYAYAKRNIDAGERFGLSDVFFAIPGEDDQYNASNFGKYNEFNALTNIIAGDAVTRKNTNSEGTEELVFEIREKILDLIRESGIVIPSHAILEVSHHYGIKSFFSFGSCMITVVNRDYCKKLIFLLPGQQHPAMFHKSKEESFFLVYGDLRLLLDEKVVPIEVGDVVTIGRGVVHEFSSPEKGAIIEEVSTSHVSNDSFYLDEEINRNPYRKTYVNYWVS